MFPLFKDRQKLFAFYCQLKNMSSIQTQCPPLNFLNGKRIFASEVLTQIGKNDPATGTFLFNVACSGSKDVNISVQSAKKAFEVWSRYSPRERGQLLIAAASKIREKVEEIAIAEVRDTGKPIWEARIDITGCADSFDYYGGVAAAIHGDHYQLSNYNFAMVQREPLGVVAGIGAWNYPFQVMSWKVAPALACGNTFVYKPSEFTPTTSLILAEILSEVGLPPDVLNVVQGNHKTGELLCKHPDIRKVTFTGSVPTGIKIMQTCADTMKKITLELGGKSALIVFDDADVKNSVKAALMGNFLTQGEVCTNCTRIYVQKNIMDVFIHQLTECVKKLKIGDPFDKTTDVGAVINEAHGNKILNYIESAKNEGATIVHGGQRVFPENLHLKGFFISPCIISNCTDDLTVVKEEIFGPVVSIMPFDCEDEVVKRANASPYGLAAGVMTRNIQRAHRVASNLQAGIIWINNYNIFPPEVPFGGYKMSGMGRENGLAAIDDFTQLKTVVVEMNSDIDCPLYKK